MNTERHGMAPRTRPPAEETRTPLQKQILAALRDEIEPAETPLAYKLGLFAAACANLLLPLLYFGLIFLVGHALYWNACYNDPGSGFLGLLYYFGTYCVGGITLIFLVKPLFARGTEDSPPLILKRSAEPFLFEYVEALCEVVDAPVPTSIRLACEPNASAGFSGGLTGLLTGRMTLTIGLTLVVGVLGFFQLAGAVRSG